MKILLQSRKRGSINERLHLLAKDEKGYPFYQLALVATRRKRVPFLSILLSLKTIGKGVKFQDITPIRATFTNTIASVRVYFNNTQLATNENAERTRIII